MNRRGPHWSVAYVLLLAGSAAAAEPIGLDTLRIHSLATAPTMRTPANETTELGKRVSGLADHLREHVEGLRAAAPSGVIRRQPARAAMRVQTRWRPAARTPMQVRGQLQPAAGGSEVAVDETARTFLRLQRALLHLDDPDRELVLQHNTRDDLGRRHLRFAQRYRGVVVWPAELIVHVDATGGVDLLDGAYVATPRMLDTQPTICADAAITRARDAVAGGAHASRTDSQLIIYAPGNRVPRLAWKVDLTVSVMADWVVVVDALNGAVLTAFNQVDSRNVVGSGEDVFGDTVPLNVFDDAGTFYMVDTSKPMFDPTSQPPAADTTRGGIVIQDARNQPPDPFNDPYPTLFDVNSSSATSWNPSDAVSASFNLSQVYDYYFERHGRNSIDGQGGSIFAAVRVGQNFDNAFFSSAVSTMFFGDAEPFAGALDVVGHELTHGVTRSTANLISLDQAGAMNEGFSDIFGEAVEARTFGAPDWLDGGDLSQPRNLADPAASGNPAKFSQFVVTDSDRGGVHVNSTILSHAFYLLADGLDGALGIRDAERIFYRALTTHLVANSRFVDARLACIASAEEIFGSNSQQAQKTAAAFDAVEVFDGRGTPQPPSFPPVNGIDATLFLLFDNDSQSYFLGRREGSLGDRSDGVLLAETAVAATRPSVSGDGEVAAFVSADNDVCLIKTDGTKINADDATLEECLGFPGLISSVAMAPDGARFGFVLQDESGTPENRIRVIDLQPTPRTRTFTLVAPTLDGGSTDTVLNADTMDFTADGRFLIYDALNELQVSNGAALQLRSIFALDLETNTTFTIVPPTRGFDISSPALSQTSDNFVTFDAFDLQSQQSTIIALNLTTGVNAIIATVSSGFGVPGYSGDDSAIVYSQRDDTTATEFSLRRQPLAADRLTPIGDPVLWLRNADFGVIYRRGTFTGPRPCTGDCNEDGKVTIDEVLTGVNIALGGLQPTACALFDADKSGRVTVDEILSAVNNALGSCG